MVEMTITKEIWKDINNVLAKHRIPYTTHFEHRDIQKAMECPDVTVHDLHILINLVIPDYYDDGV